MPDLGVEPRQFDDRERLSSSDGRDGLKNTPVIDRSQGPWERQKLAMGVRSSRHPKWFGSLKLALARPQTNIFQAPVIQTLIAASIAA
jgi:hypothetical protein